jgi:hypothetical protein
MARVEGYQPGAIFSQGSYQNGQAFGVGETLIRQEIIWFWIVGDPQATVDEMAKCRYSIGDFRFQIAFGFRDHLR